MKKEACLMVHDEWLPKAKGFYSTKSNWVVDSEKFHMVAG